MTWRLVYAQVWRRRWHLLLLAMLGSNWALQSEADGFADSIGARFMMGMPLLSAFTAITGLGLFWSRDVRVLPIARRDALRSVWLAALALPLAITSGRFLVVLVQFALGLTLTRGIEAVAIAAVWDTIFIGASLTLMQLPDSPFTSFRQTFGSFRGAAWPVLMIVWIIVPFVGPEIVPSALSDVTWLHVCVVLIGIVITAWPLVTAPDQWPTLGVLYDADRGTPVKQTTTKRTHRVVNRFPGLPGLVMRSFGFAALVATLVFVGSSALAYRLEEVRSPFDAGMKDIAFFLIGGPFFLLILGPVGWATGVAPYLRRLKTLPVSAMQILVAMTMLPLMMPLVFWTLATGVHLVVGSEEGTSWRIGSLALLCGVFALTAAVYAHFKSTVVLLVGSVAPLIVAMGLMEFFDKGTVDAGIGFWFPLVGLTGVAGAVLLNHRTITRSSSSSPAYRGVPGASLYRGGGA